jgi:hypothetical protein
MAAGCYEIVGLGANRVSVPHRRFRQHNRSYWHSCIWRWSLWRSRSCSGTRVSVHVKERQSVHEVLIQPEQRPQHRAERPYDHERHPQAPRCWSGGREIGECSQLRECEMWPVLHGQGLTHVTGRSWKRILYSG